MAGVGHQRMSVDPEAVRLEIVARLPVRTRWLIEGKPLDFDFSDARRRLRQLTAADVNEATTIEPAWLDLLIVGRSSYAEGGGATPWIAVRALDGFVVQLDIEREDAMSLLNSSIERFIDTFMVLDPHLRLGGSLTPEVRAAVASIDADTYTASAWRILIDDR